MYLAGLEREGPLSPPAAVLPPPGGVEYIMKTVRAAEVIPSLATDTSQIICGQKKQVLLVVCCDSVSTQDSGHVPYE
jgi:hypothetical protein